MAKNFSKMEEDNPVMSILNAAKSEEAKNSLDILHTSSKAQVSANYIEEKTNSEQNSKSSETSAQSTETAEKKETEVKKILMNISIRETTKKEWKMFFLEHDLSMTQGIETAVEYLMSEVKKGTIRLSKGGITK